MKLHANVSALDRFIRFIVIIAVIILLWTEVLKGAIGTILGIIAIILVFAVVYGFCPVYALLKISTKKSPATKENKS